MYFTYCVTYLGLPIFRPSFVLPRLFRGLHGITSLHPNLPLLCHFLSIIQTELQHSCIFNTESSVRVCSCVRQKCLWSRKGQRAASTQLNVLFWTHSRFNMSANVRVHHVWQSHASACRMSDHPDLIPMNILFLCVCALEKNHPALCHQFLDCPRTNRSVLEVERKRWAFSQQKPVPSHGSADKEKRKAAYSALNVTVTYKKLARDELHSGYSSTNGDEKSLEGSWYFQSRMWGNFQFVSKVWTQTTQSFLFGPNRPEHETAILCVL